MANTDGSGTLVCYSDSSNPPTTIRGREGGNPSTLYATVTMPVKSGDYWKVVASHFVSCYWIPLS